MKLKIFVKRQKISAYCGYFSIVAVSLSNVTRFELANNRQIKHVAKKCYNDQR